MIPGTVRIEPSGVKRRKSILVTLSSMSSSPGMNQLA
jgi:hypothetical protein